MNKPEGKKTTICRYLAEYRYAECRYAKCHYAECRYGECHYAECRGALVLHLVFGQKSICEHAI